MPTSHHSEPSSRASIIPLACTFRYSSPAPACRNHAISYEHCGHTRRVWTSSILNSSRAQSALRRSESHSRRSAGYPFFVQKYASAVWNKHLGGTITLRDAETTVRGVCKLVEKTLYGSAFATRTAREITVALAVADLGPGAHALGDGVRSLSTTSDTRRNLGLDRRPCKRCAHQIICTVTRTACDYASSVRTSDAGRARVNRSKSNSLTTVQKLS